MAQQFLWRLIARWFVSGLGLWIAAGLLGEQRIFFKNGWQTVVIASFFLALVNMAIKPLLVILSLPAIILTLGLFMLFVNGLLIMIVHWVYDPLYVKNFGVAVATGIIIGLVNFLVTKVMEDI
jgi:putative membrane protein